MSTLEKAIALAATQHAGQLDKGGQPYILHPLRLMLQFSNSTLQIIAVLHDILEDTATTTEDLEALGFSAKIIQAIQALTKQTGESRLEAAKRTALNPLATQVKYVDVLDNMNLTRINNPTPRDFARLEEYKVVLEILKQAKKPLNPLNN
ncbi:HD domain-containing protein [Acinetobacter johnsonii]|uniref:HD domain-containing protein n=1 Tax=Acinetobacter johnsonii TaxID=40214 RepID=A0A427V1B9_ACIJO|nr:HD domain-containing protein [Acinetobacter johnsonii]MDH0710908.1 HD domain-containing protein [Acinetobacter johnsonii]PZO94129.1 MAG: phosphohydrolase [Acinetobacter johnsonii]RSE26398.1 HD domain-containing protein [Acinetobacter johnsonii]